MNIYEPTQYAVSARQEAEEEKAQYLDEEATEKTQGIISDWRELHAYHNRYDLSCLIDDVIMDWDKMDRPALPGHDEVTPAVIEQALSDVEEGNAYSAESFILCAAIFEAMDSTVSGVNPTDNYEKLFEKIKKFVLWEWDEEEDF